MRHLLLAAAAATLAAGAAQAAPSFSFSVWTGAPDGVSSTTLASLAARPTGLASAAFTYTGNVNFNVGGSGAGPNLAGDFIGAGGISGFSSPRGTYANEAAFRAATLSTAGDTTDSYFLITGSYSAAAAVPNESITHDDGASLYVDGVNVFASPAETAVRTETFILPGGVHNFQLVYVEANGAPSVLNIVFPQDTIATSAPEPATITLVGTGLLGLAGILRRRRR